MTRRIITEHTITSPKLTQALDLVVVTDLHDRDYTDVLPQLRAADAILVVGDLVQRHTGGWQVARRFLADAPACAPTFLSIGNHERKLAEHDAFMACVTDSDVTLLDNRVIRFAGLAIGGLSSQPPEQTPDTSVVDALAREEGYRLLMCHHPEYYYPYVQGRGIDLTLAGHAHGGQIQFFGHGVYAPGQGFFPKLTHGFYDGRHLLVCRGLTNGSNMPRWGNPCELIILHMRPEG